jgi:hypothetical protein
VSCMIGSIAPSQTRRPPLVDEDVNSRNKGERHDDGPKVLHANALRKRPPALHSARLQEGKRVNEWGERERSKK